MEAIAALDRIAKINRREPLTEESKAQIKKEDKLSRLSGHEQQQKLSVARLVRQEGICLNLMVMTSISVTVAVNYYLFTFLTVTFEHPYMEVLFSTLAEILAYATSGYLFTRLGAKASLTLSLGLSALSGYAILLVGSEEVVFFTVLAMLCKFGISATYNV